MQRDGYNSTLIIYRPTHYSIQLLDSGILREVKLDSGYGSAPGHMVDTYVSGNERPGIFGWQIDPKRNRRSGLRTDKILSTFDSALGPVSPAHYEILIPCGRR